MEFIDSTLYTDVIATLSFRCVLRFDGVYGVWCDLIFYSNLLTADLCWWLNWLRISDMCVSQAETRRDTYAYFPCRDKPQTTAHGESEIRISILR